MGETDRRASPGDKSRPRVLRLYCPKILKSFSFVIFCFFGGATLPVPLFDLFLLDGSSIDLRGLRGSSLLILYLTSIFEKGSWGLIASKNSSLLILLSESRSMRLMIAKWSASVDLRR